MKRSVLLISVIMILTVGLSVGCIRSITGSGKLVEESFDFRNFTRVEAHNGFKLELTRSSQFSIEITADDNLYEFIEVDKSGETLRIKLDRINICHSCTLRAIITMPNLYELDLSGGSQASINGFSSSHDFSVQLSGGSRVSGDITAADADFNLSGGSAVTLSGSADDLDIDGSGGSQLNLEEFAVENADINLSGGGKGTVNVTGTLDVNLSGGSQLLYTGGPIMGDIDLSGGSNVRKKS